MWLEIIIGLILWTLFCFGVFKLIQQWNLKKLIREYKKEDDKGRRFENLPISKK